MAHLSARSIHDYFYNDFIKIEDYFTFGFVRDPLKRFVSGFNETHKELALNASSIGGKCMDEYKKTIKIYAIRMMDSEYKEGFYTHTKPQKEIFYYENEKIANMIIKIEDYKKFIGAISKNINDDVFIALLDALNGKPRNSKNFHVGIHRLLDEDIIGQLIEYYSEDYELFDYDIII